jgi:hypothetical protein
MDNDAPEQSGIFQCLTRGDGQPHLIGHFGVCIYCGVEEMILEAEFDTDEEEF